jgi:hypothetical protein
MVDFREKRTPDWRRAELAGPELMIAAAAVK